MAEFQAEPKSNLDQSPAQTALTQLKKDLEGYRQLMLPLNKVLEWEQKHYPAILVAAITFLFAIVWYLEPSVLTLFSTIGVIACMIDFAVPMLTSYLFASKQWTVREEMQYERICTRLLNAKTHCENFKFSLSKLKAEKPKVYLLVMMGLFATLAWIGSLIDNLFLTYLMVVFVVLVPGLRKHGILQRIRQSTVDVVARMLKGQGKKSE